MGKVGRLCTVCQSAHRHQVDIGLTHRVPARVLAARFTLSRDAIHRHAKSHLSPVQRASILAHKKPQAIDLDALRVSESEGLLSALVGQRARLQGHAEAAADQGDARAAVSAEGAITANLTLVAKLLGQLAVQHNVTHTSILISADYLALRAALVDALRPFPEAARAVGAALVRLEASAAETITAAARARQPAPEPRLIEHEPTPPVRPLPPPPPPWPGQC
jgi:hypothetical protein